MVFSTRLRLSLQGKNKSSLVEKQGDPHFIATEDWPAGSPDLNPSDYKLYMVRFRGDGFHDSSPKIRSFKVRTCPRSEQFSHRCSAYCNRRVAGQTSVLASSLYCEITVYQN